ncbi:MAG TPA: molybdopterin-dependent oxidoreductase [Iamia sp.]|nr:molybdopterin-dependent oxidoreductase [Iamia sp.]
MPSLPVRPLVSGLLAAGVGVAVGELAGGVLTEAGSPVVAVGGLVIDNVPPGVKDFAIETFGEDDKAALVVGTLVLLALLGMGLALVARRRPRLAAAVVVAVSLVGVVATRDQTTAGLLVAAAPSLLGAAAAVGTLAALRRTFVRTVPGTVRTERAGEPVDGMPPRREFLVGTGTALVLAGAAAGTGRFLQARNSASASRAAVTLPRPVESLPPVPEATSIGVDGVVPFTTPNRSFYRIDKNISPLQVKTEGYTLTVTGMVDRELEIPWADLLERDMREYDITLTCVSNLIGGNLVGNARWLGFPLRDLLDEAGVREGVDQVVGRSADDYTGGFPLEAAYDRDAIVAVGMNGEPLPIAHGFPVRLVVPGLYGYIASVKWLTEIELTTFAAFDSYWVRRDYADRAPIKVMSRIDTPRSLAKPAAGTIPVAGVAWAQTRGIAKVEVQVDDEDWAEAELAEALGDDTWRQWTFPAELDAGFHTIKVRATDGDGELQTEERADPLPDGASGWHTIRVSVQG